MKYITINLSLLFFLAFILSACGQNKAEHKSPQGYDLTKPEKFNMPEVLTEVSGITFYKGDPGILYAEEDEEGRVYWLKPGDRKAEYASFGKNGDYEDIAILSDRFYVLKSSGDVFSFAYNSLRQSKIDSVSETKLLPKGEYEGMFADESDGKLYILCKECKADKKEKSNTGYVLKVNGNSELELAGSFGIDVSKIASLLGEQKFQFKPSGLARNARTGEWYILSSVKKIIVVTDQKFNVKEVYKLDPTLFLQPEGIAFDKHHNLYISNEGDEISRGNVLKFSYR